MLLRANYVRDLHLVVVDHGGEMVQARTVGTLDDVVLLAGPIDADLAAHQIVEYELALARHEQANDALAAFCFQAPRVGVGFGAPAAAVEEWPAGFLGLIALGLQLFRSGEIAIGRADSQPRYSMLDTR
jgi:hypothetical protein